MKKSNKIESERKKATFQNLSPSKFPYGMSQLDKMIVQNSGSKSVLTCKSLRSLHSAAEELNQNSNIENIRSSIRYCTNHSNKHGSYEITVDSEIQVYCQKCAILLASQGFKADKIVNNPNLKLHKPTKSSSIVSDNMDSIIILADNISKSLGQKKAELKHYKEQSEYIIYSQYQSMNTYFNNIEAMISYQRNLYMEYFNEEQKHIQSVYSSLQNLLSVSIKDIFKMKRDIKQMEEQMKAGKTITDKLERCRNQLLSCKQISLSWNKEDIMPKIVFHESEELEQIMQFNIVNKTGGSWDRSHTVNSINFSFDIERRQMEVNMKR